MFTASIESLSTTLLAESIYCFWVLEMASLQELQRIDRELFSELTESPINPNPNPNPNPKTFPFSKGWEWLLYVRDGFRTKPDQIDFDCIRILFDWFDNRTYVWSQMSANNEEWKLVGCMARFFMLYLWVASNNLIDGNKRQVFYTFWSQ